MVFSSVVFVFYFLPIALGVYYVLPQRWRQVFLTAISYIFYGWANPWFVLLMVYSTLNDYICGLMISGKWNPVGTIPEPDHTGFISSPRQRKVAVFLSVVSNLGLLAFFKYFVFVQENFNWIMEAFGREAMEIYQVALPVGISFYTFQTMTYSIDLYRGEARPARNLLDFSCYVALFSQLVAGPILRYRDLADQLSQRSHTWDKFARGSAFFILGFGKKILLANPMGEVADAAFDAADLMWYDAWAGVVGYAFQIYFDFSGYSDMAIGLGLMFGFHFPENFRSPYRADSITDFWRRWHISLSTFLRDYLYIPLGGNRKGVARTYANLAVVMVLGGLWHGAKWNFVVWGAIHGAMLALERAMGKESLYARLWRPQRVLITFVTVLFAWVFFRAIDLAGALSYIGAMFGLGGRTPGAHLVSATIFTRDHVVMFAACSIIVWAAPRTWVLAERVTSWKWVLLAVLFLWANAVMFTQSFNPFIYFQF